ncbi:SphA family protein [Marinobacterium stanieri]|uniref:SphA family protein n=1 Tax=Marinobacterium stanieri TaxID=49186 RepID=UPI000255A929|nr:transporter [Marinobacterium stanieri]
MDVKLLVGVIGTALVSAHYLPVVHAEEGGAGHYVPGALATLIDLPPTAPGMVFETAYLNYEGEVGTTLAGGLLAANLDATSEALLLGGFYTFEQQVMGAWYSTGVLVPYVDMDVTASVQAGPGMVRRHDQEAGLGDITLLPLMMAWKQDEWQFNAVLPIYAPTGEYKAGRLANPGKNYWTFDPTVGVAYSGQNLWNWAVHTGFAINTENKDTDYKSGTVWHVEGSVQKLFPMGSGLLGVGLNAFHYDQITGDSGKGATLGSFKGSTSGVGPVLTYLLPGANDNMVFELRWLPETSVSKRLEGDYIWGKFVYQF